MNPARTFGPAMVAGNMDRMWVSIMFCAYTRGPFLSKKIRAAVYLQFVKELEKLENIVYRPL